MKDDFKEEIQRTKSLEKELRRKEKALVETAALLVLQKKAKRFVGPRGRLFSASDREKAVELIGEARAASARLKLACDILGISDRIYQRWTRYGYVIEVQRPIVDRLPLEIS